MNNGCKILMCTLVSRRVMDCICKEIISTLFDVTHGCNIFSVKRNSLIIIVTSCLIIDDYHIYVFYRNHENQM